MKTKMKMKMKTKLKFTAIALLMLGSSVAYAQSTATASASADVVTPISISKTVDMGFGNVAVSASTGGTVVLSTDGVRTNTGGVTLPSVNGTVAAASFDVTGQANYTYAITIPAADHTISNGTNNMIVNSFVSSPAGTGVLDGTGAQTINVGATLNVSAGQAAGSYTSGTNFDVTVNYN